MYLIPYSKFTTNTSIRMENSLAISVAIRNQGSRVKNKQKYIYDDKFWAQIIFGYKELGPKIF